MRYSRMVTGKPKKKKKANIILVVVILGVAAYLIGAGAAGGWIAENLINPIFNAGNDAAGGDTDPLPESPPAQGLNTADPESTPVSAAWETSATRREEQIMARNISLYTLQAGAFSDNANAAAAAKSISARGGAGYIAFDGNLYRTLIAGYTRESDATSVRTELTNQGVATTVFVLESGALEFKIGAEPTQIEAVKACFNIVPQTVETLEQIIFDADKGKNVDDRLKALGTNAKNATEQLKTVISSDTDAMVRLDAYMNSLCNTLENLSAAADVTGVDFSSRLKYNMIGIVMDYSSFLKDLGG